MSASGIVIIGTGLAGYTLAKEFRKLDSHTPLHLITCDDGAFYSKPMLSNAIAKHKTAQTLVNFTAEQMAAQLNASIWTDTQVSDIDAASRTVVCDNGDLSYNKLVLAVGASQIIPDLQGDAAHAVMSVNNLWDYARFRDRLAQAKHVGIIGPGLIGCEFANDLAQGGMRVSVIGPGETPLERLLPREAGAMLQAKLAALGIDWYLGEVVSSINHSDGAFNLELSNGKQVKVDLVLSATGLRANTQLAKRLGADINRAIVVNRQLQTTVDDVYALGDCAEVEGLVLPFVLPIMQGARALAKTLAGTATDIHYPAMPVVVKTPAHNIVVSPPAKDAQGKWQVTTQADGVNAQFKNAQDDLLGFALTGTCVSEKQSLSKLLPTVF